MYPIATKKLLSETFPISVFYRPDYDVFRCYSYNYKQGRAVPKFKKRVGSD